MMTRDRLAAGIMAGLLMAVPAGNMALANCLASGAPAQSAIDAFKADPTSILQSGSADIVKNIRAFVATDATAASNVIKDILPKADPAMRGVIAAGLGQAASICGGRNPNAASEIQRVVLASGDSDFINAFRAASGDIRTAAVGAGGGGAGGGLGGSLGGAGVINGFGQTGRGSTFGPIGGFSLSNPAGGTTFSSGSLSVTYMQRASSSVSGSR